MVEPIRFKFDYQKCIQAIQFLAERCPGITQYYVGKVMFFADKQHIIDWGRSICGDRYVAMEHGPVPSGTYDIIKSDSGEPDEIEDIFLSRIEVVEEGNRKHLHPKENMPEITALSESDKEYLLKSLKKYGRMGFGEIKKESHKDPAYQEAWARNGLNNEMNLGAWLSEDQIEFLKSSPNVYRRRFE